MSSEGDFSKIPPAFKHLFYEMMEELLDYKANWFTIADEFKIPLDERRDPKKAGQVVERMHTYLSGYVGRRSIAERENGAAFVDPKLTPLLDPDIDKTP